MQTIFQNGSIVFPGGPLSADSPLYIERPPIESLACSEIEKPGTMVRIKAPRQMGKSSLLNRLLTHVSKQGYKILQIDFQEVDEQILESLNLLLRWLSTNASYQLQLPPRLDQYWDEEVGSKVSCSWYWQSYLLAALDEPTLLVLSNIDRLFEYPKTAREMLALLRSWYEKAKQVENWRQLRFVVVYTTDAYVPLDINQSPFNVGLPLKLAPFTLEQMQELDQRYRSQIERFKLIENKSDKIKTLEIAPLQLAVLHELTGGHPYLVNLALYHFYRAETDPAEILQRSTTEAGIYGNHLRRLLNILQTEPSLEDAFKQVISTAGAVSIESTSAYKLDGLGLVVREGDRVRTSCNLYQIFFKEKLFSYREILLKLEHLNRAGLRLDQLMSAVNQNPTAAGFPTDQPEQNQAQHQSQLDELTQIPNRQTFEAALQTEWKRCLREQEPIAAILIDLDYFKVYNDTYGQASGDLCLQKIAAILRAVIQRPGDLAARYGGEEFILLLPHTDSAGAGFVAETIRLQVAALEIPCDYSMMDGLPSSVLTVSAGVTAIVPNAITTPETFLATLNRAIYQSKRQGRNRVSTIES